jgi:plasmid stabilization system protein ParE
MTRAKDVVFSPEAEAQFVQLYDYIAAKASPAIAQSYTDAIVERCERLGEMPLAGVARDDIRRGLRTTFFRKRVVIAYSAGAKAVTVLAIFYGGQDYESLLREE